MGMSKYDRLLYILNLLRSRRNLNAAKIAAECGVTERSIYRDIISLSQANIPIYYDNGYKLASDNFLPPLNLNGDEYRFLLSALKSSPLNKADKYQELSRQVEAKISGSMSERVRHENRFRPHSTHVDETPVSDNPRNLKILPLLEKAIADSRVLDLEYKSIDSGTTKRKVEPYFVIFRGRAFYFVAYCRLRKEFRTFRLNRVASISNRDELFNRRSDITAESYFEGSWSVFAGPMVKVVVNFSGRAARIILGTAHHPGEKIKQISDNKVEYTVEVRGYKEIMRWILGFGELATVIEPQQLRDELSSMGKYLKKQYQ